MNYLKVYCNLIRKTENRTPPEGYTEKHHTFPKSIFGDNDRIVVLTAREHYIAHLLLEKIYIKRYGIGDENTRKMTFACVMMCGRNIKFNSHLYEQVRVRYSNQKREEMLGENNPRFGSKMTEKTKDKIRKSKIGKPLSEETKRKMSISRLGNTNRKRKQPPEPKPKVVEKFNHSEYTKSKISDSKSVTPYEVKSPSGETFLTNNLNKFCRENPQYNLTRRLLCSVANGLQTHHKGWTVRKLAQTT